MLLQGLGTVRFRDKRFGNWELSKTEALGTLASP